MDTNTDGLVSLAEFKNGLTLDKDEPDDPPAGAEALKILNKIIPKPLGDKEDESKQSGPLDIPHKILRKFEIALVDAGGLSYVYRTRITR